MKVYNNILETISKTPMIKIDNLYPDQSVEIFAKFESLNPGGSIKDRICLNMINTAESEGLIDPKKTTIIEPTSGNTGIGLALVCAAKGYDFHVVSSDAFSKEKLDMMAALGAEVDVIESHGGGITLELLEKMRARVSELLEDPNTYYTDQFKNFDIVTGFQSLGKEVIEQLDKPVDVFCDAVGTAGSLVGVSTALKNAGQNPRVIVLEPSSSPMITKGEKGSHSVEGIALGFVPNLLTPETYDEARAIDVALQRVRHGAVKESLKRFLRFSE